VSCLLCLATAVPQGYNYQAQQKVQSQGQVGQPHPLSIPQFANLAEHSLLQQALQAPKVQHVLSGGEVTTPYSTLHQNQDSAYQQQPTQLVGNLAYNALPQSYQPQQQQHLVSKDIYVHVPPAEEPEDRYPQPNLPPAPARKHYRIVFIKAPTPSATKTALRIKQAPVEEKMSLTKK